MSLPFQTFINQIREKKYVEALFTAYSIFNEQSSIALLSGTKGGADDIGPQLTVGFSGTDVREEDIANINLCLETVSALFNTNELHAAFNSIASFAASGLALKQLAVKRNETKEIIAEKQAKEQPKLIQKYELTRRMLYNDPRFIATAIKIHNDLGTAIQEAKRKNEPKVVIKHSQLSIEPIDLQTAIQRYVLLRKTIENTFTELNFVEGNPVNGNKLNMWDIQSLYRRCFDEVAFPRDLKGKSEALGQPDTIPTLEQPKELDEVVNTCLQTPVDDDTASPTLEVAIAEYEAYVIQNDRLTKKIQKQPAVVDQDQTQVDEIKKTFLEQLIKPSSTDIEKIQQQGSEVITTIQQIECNGKDSQKKAGIEKQFKEQFDKTVSTILTKPQNIFQTSILSDKNNPTAAQSFRTFLLGYVEKLSRNPKELKNSVQAQVKPEDLYKQRGAVNQALYLDPSIAPKIVQPLMSICGSNENDSLDTFQFKTSSLGAVKGMFENLKVRPSSLKKEGKKIETLKDKYNKYIEGATPKIEKASTIEDKLNGLNDLVTSLKQFCKENKPSRLNIKRREEYAWFRDLERGLRLFSKKIDFLKMLNDFANGKIDTGTLLNKLEKFIAQNKRNFFSRTFLKEDPWFKGVKDFVKALKEQYREDMFEYKVSLYKAIHKPKEGEEQNASQGLSDILIASGKRLIRPGVQSEINDYNQFIKQLSRIIHYSDSSEAAALENKWKELRQQANKKQPVNDQTVEELLDLEARFLASRSSGPRAGER